MPRDAVSRTAHVGSFLLTVSCFLGVDSESQMNRILIPVKSTTFRLTEFLVWNSELSAYVLFNRGYVVVRFSVAYYALFIMFISIVFDIAMKKPLCLKHPVIYIYIYYTQYTRHIYVYILYIYISTFTRQTEFFIKTIFLNNWDPVDDSLNDWFQGDLNWVPMMPRDAWLLWNSHIWVT